MCFCINMSLANARVMTVFYLFGNYRKIKANLAEFNWLRAAIKAKRLGKTNQ